MSAQIFAALIRDDDASVLPQTLIFKEPEILQCCGNPIRVGLVLDAPRLTDFFRASRATLVVLLKLGEPF